MFFLSLNHNENSNESKQIKNNKPHINIKSNFYRPTAPEQGAFSGVWLIYPVSPLKKTGFPSSYSYELYTDFLFMNGTLYKLPFSILGVCLTCMCVGHVHGVTVYMSFSVFHACCVWNTGSLALSTTCESFNPSPSFLTLIPEPWGGENCHG